MGKVLPWMSRAIMKVPAMNGTEPVFENGRVKKVYANHQQIVEMFLSSLQEFVNSGHEAKLLETPVFAAYGSSRIGSDQPWYQTAYDINKAIAEKFGWSFIGGAGPGMMEATSKAAHDAGVPSYGVKIYMPGEQALNEYVDKDKVILCKELISRKYLLRKYANLVMVYPGGFGTMDEIFDILAKKDRDIGDHAPIVFIGTKLWDELETIVKKYRAKGFFRKSLEELMVVLDAKPETVVGHIEENMDKYLNVPTRKPIDIDLHATSLIKNLEQMKQITSADMVTVIGGSNFKIPVEVHDRAAAIELGAFLTESGISMIARSNQKEMPFLQLGYLNALRKGAEDVQHALFYNTEDGTEQSLYGGISSSNVSLDSRKLLHEKMVACNNSNCGFIFFPGGMSTHDVFFEAAVMMRIGLMKKVPIILFGDEDKWSDELEFLSTNFADLYGTIDAKDMDLFYRTSNMSEVKSILAQQKVKNIAERELTNS